MKLFKLNMRQILSFFDFKKNIPSLFDSSFQEEEVDEIREIIEEIARLEEEERNSQPVPVKVQCAKAFMGILALAVPTSVLLFLLLTFWNIEKEVIK